MIHDEEDYDEDSEWKTGRKTKTKVVQIIKQCSVMQTSCWSVVESVKKTASEV